MIITSVTPVLEAQKKKKKTMKISENKTVSSFEEWLDQEREIISIGVILFG